MFNPFHPLSRPLLEAFVKQNKKYFVRQQLKRAAGHFDEGIKGCFLFSQYDSLTTAQDHFGAISYDPYRFLYEWENTEHRQKLLVAANGVKEYKIYANVFQKDWERLITSRIREKIRFYIKTLGWKPDRDEQVSTNYEVQFGELFIRLRYGIREAKVKFEEIEKVY